MNKRNKKRVTSKKNAILKEKIAKKLKKKRIKEAKKTSLKKVGYHINEVEKGKYKNGVFYSKKNNKEFIFRSAYEFGYFHILESDPNVVSYLVEPLSIPYRFGSRNRSYHPDLMVLYKDGSIRILEIKPIRLVRNRIVQIKADAARQFINEFLENCSFQFITEKDIFNSDADYRNLLKKLNA